MRTQAEFQTVLTGLQDGVHVYFEPPSGLSILYPAIIYRRDFESRRYADNSPYSRMTRYMVQTIDKDPNSNLVNLVGDLELTSYVRHFNQDNLSHDVFYVYF